MTFLDGDNIFARAYAFHGETVISPSPAEKEGYCFVGYTVHNGEVVEDLSKRYITNNESFVASYAAEQYELSLNSQVSSTDKVIVTYGSTYSLPLDAFSKTGYEVVSLTVGGIPLNDSGVWTLDLDNFSDTSVSAIYTPERYRVFDTEVQYGMPYEIVTPTKKGYDFDSLCYKDEIVPLSGSNWNYDINGTDDLDVKWRPKVFSFLDTEVIFGSPYSLSVPEREGYTFEKIVFEGQTISLNGKEWMWEIDDHSAIEIFFTPNTYLYRVDSSDEAIEESLESLNGIYIKTTYHSTQLFGLEELKLSLYEVAEIFTQEGVRLAKADGELLPNVEEYTDSNGRWIRTAPVNNLKVSFKQSFEGEYVSSAEELINCLNENPDGMYVVIEDLDFKGKSISPIICFSGRLEGLNHKLKNISMKYVETPDGILNYGLFARNTGEILNLEIVNMKAEVLPDYKGGNQTITAGFIAAINDGLIEGIKIVSSALTVTSSKSGSRYQSGSLSSYADKQTGEWFDFPLGNISIVAGGVAGRNNNTVSDCQITSSNVNAWLFYYQVPTSASYTQTCVAGGVVGCNETGANITNVKIQASIDAYGDLLNRGGWGTGWVANPSVNATIIATYIAGINNGSGAFTPSDIHVSTSATCRAIARDITWGWEHNKMNQANIEKSYNTYYSGAHMHLLSEFIKDYNEHYQRCIGDSRCEEVFNKSSHDYSEWVVTRPSSSAIKGEQQRVCMICAQVETESIPLYDAPTFDNGADIPNEIHPDAGTENGAPSDGGGNETEEMPASGDTVKLIIVFAVIVVVVAIGIALLIIKKRC